MKCYNHNEIDAVATCSRCGKSLCKECADKYRPILCDDCYQEILQENEQAKNDALIDTESEWIKSLIFGVISALVFYNLAADGSDIGTAIFAALWGFTWPWGFAVVKYILASSPVAIIADGWWWFFVFLLFGLLIGPFAFVYNLIKYFVTMNKIKKM